MSLRRILSALALTTALASVVPACVVSGTARMRGTVAYSEPPPPREEYVESRPGFIWVQGRWERERRGYRYDRGQWMQRGSSWHWVEGNWVAVGGTSGGGTVISDGRDNVIESDTRDAPGGVGVVTRPRGDGRGTGPSVRPAPSPGGGMYPTQPPPPLRDERMEQRRGFIWVTGRWDWRGGNWEWVDGHWERQRVNKTWVQGRWELQGNYYIWIEGGWR